MSRGATLNHTTVLVTEDCIQCAVIFALPRDMRNRRLEDHKNFYCPNGHPMCFSGPTAEEKRITELEKEKAQVEKRLQWAKDSEKWTHDQLMATRKERTALKGQLTKARKRVGAGVCPVPECHRQFPNLRDHMQTKHPAYKVPEPEVADAANPVKK